MRLFIKRHAWLPTFVSYVLSAAAFYPLLMGICWIVDTVSPRV